MQGGVHMVVTLSDKHTKRNLSDCFRTVQFKVDGHDMDNVDAVKSADGINPVAQLQSHIFELGWRHDQVMSALSNLINSSTRSYVYIPRERQIVPFSGDLAKDVQTIDECIDEVHG